MRRRSALYKINSEITFLQTKEYIFYYKGVFVITLPLLKILNIKYIKSCF
jgi:hypothetical protein